MVTNMRHRILEEVNSDAQKDLEGKIRKSTFEDIGVTQPARLPSYAQAQYPTLYRHENKCETCGFRVEYLSHSKEMDESHTCKRCEYYDGGQNVTNN